MAASKAGAHPAAGVRRAVLCCALLLTAAAAPALAEEQGVVATQSSALRVREAPSLDARVIAGAERGERVAILEKSSDGTWLRIRTAKGHVGWASAKFVDVVQPEAQAPKQQTGFFIGLALLGLMVVLLVTHALRTRNKSREIEKQLPPAPSPPPLPAQPRPAHAGSGGRRAAWACSVVLAAGVAAAMYYFVPSTPEPVIVEPDPPAPQPQPQVRIETPADVSACREAMAIVDAMPANTVEQREAKELEARWIEYLEQIQAGRDHANWSGAPCEQYVQNHRLSAPEAIARGLVTIEARGKDLSTVTLRVTLTSSAGAYIVVPVGTLFASSSGGTQDMMAAGSFRFTFAPLPARDTRASLLEQVNPIGTAHATYRRAQTPRWVEGGVAAYCINRWRAVPGPTSQLSVSFPDATGTLPRLIACLQRQEGSHHLKQLVVWMVSDGLINMTRSQLEDKLAEEMRAKARDATGAELADIVKQLNPAVGEDVLRQIRGLSRAELAQVQSILLRRLAEQEAQAYLEAGPLLRSCGYDVSASPFFR